MSEMHEETLQILLIKYLFDGNVKDLAHPKDVNSFQAPIDVWLERLIDLIRNRLKECLRLRTKKENACYW